MGIDYQGAVIVGLHVEDLINHEKYEEFVDGGLDQASPYYDGFDQAILGVFAECSDTYSASEITGSVDAKIRAAKDKFKEKTGLDGKVWITPVGW